MAFNTYSSHNHIIIWDHHGTIESARNPSDTSKIMLPNVEATMASVQLNIICSGTKVDHETRDWDPNIIIQQFTELMQKLPIALALFSPAKGSTQCWIMVKQSDGTIDIRKAHEDARYIPYIGRFKKPDIGMLVVLRDLVAELFGYTLDKHTAIFIGDMPQDQQAAEGFGIPFIDARIIHRGIFTVATHEPFEKTT